MRRHTRVLVRSDSAAATNGLLWHLWDRYVRFSVTGRNNLAIETAILALNESTIWKPALDAPHLVAGRKTLHPNRGEVTEITAHPTIAAWVGPTRKTDEDSLRLPPGTRVIVRREPLHPGAQQRRFDTVARRVCWGCWRHVRWGWVSDRGVVVVVVVAWVVVGVSLLFGGDFGYGGAGGGLVDDVAAGGVGGDE